MKSFAVLPLSALLLAQVLVTPTFAADPYAESAQAKISMIREDQAPANAKIPISPREWNAWVAAQIAEEGDIGLRQPKLTLGAGTVTFEALADLSKLAAKAGGAAALVGQMLAGERPIKLRMRPVTNAGKATVNLELLEISGVPLSGMLLNGAANLLLAVAFDDVRVNEPFEMGHRIDHASVEPAGVAVTIANVPPPPPVE